MTFMRIRDGNVEVSQFGTDQVLGDSPSDEELRASLMESITPVPGIPSDQVEKVRSQLSPIELGIERNGLNTNNVSSDFSEEMSMRGAPKGTWGLYASPGGMCYRMHCSSREKRAMAHEYEEDQRYLKMLTSEGFLQVKDYDQEDVQRVLLAAFPQSPM